MFPKTGFPGGSVVKNLPVDAGGLDPWVRKIPWKRKWQPTPVFLPGESLGQRSLVGYSPWDQKELDMTEVTWHTPPPSPRNKLFDSAQFSSVQSISSV